MLPIFFLSLFLTSLIIIHMTRPRFERRMMSAARFFRDLPPAKAKETRFKLGNPFHSPALYVQALVLTLLLAALLTSQISLARTAQQGLGLWILIDTSASMSTQQSGRARLEVAQTEFENLLTQAGNLDLALCFRLSAFDLERQDLITTQNETKLRQTATSLAVRPLGTDISLIRSLPNLLSNQNESDCPITHLVIISDLSAPAWALDPGPVSMIWRDISQPVDNVGLSEIQASRNPLTGLVREINLTVTAHGQPPVGASLQVQNDAGQTVLSQGLNWQGNTWRGQFAPADPGLYSIEIFNDADPYLFDNQAVIEVSDAQMVQVDWQISDKTWLGLLGWTETTTQPNLRLLAYPSASIDAIDETPTLLLGPGYQQTDSTTQIRDFYEDSPLLADLNFDVAETLNFTGIDLPSDFRPVLRDTAGQVWLAQRDDPPSAYIPGLPTGTDDNLGNFSLTVFFNALRWLLQARELPPLYTLTSPPKPASYWFPFSLASRGRGHHPPTSLFGRFYQPASRRFAFAR